MTKVPCSKFKNMAHVQLTRDLCPQCLSYIKFTSVYFNTPPHSYNYMFICFSSLN